MKKILITITCLLYSLFATAQKEGRELVDSLRKAMPAAKDDTIRSRMYNRIFNTLIAIDMDEAMQCAREGLAHVEKMKWSKGIAVFQSNMGQSYSAKNNFDSARYFYEKALLVNEQINNTYNMAVTCNNLGTAAQNIRADYPMAALYYFKALRLAEGIPDSGLIALSLTNIARIYHLQQNHAKALDLARRALLIREKLGNPDDIALSLETIGKLYFSLSKLKEAESAFTKALAIFESSGNLPGMATMWSSLSLVYGNDYRKIVEARIRSKALWDEVNPMHNDAITNTGNLGVVYLDIVRYDTLHLVKYGDVIPDNKAVLLRKASENLHAAINMAAQTGDMDNKSFFTGTLAELQEYEGDFKQAFYNYRQFKDMQDSIYSQGAKNKIAEAESQRAIDQKNSEIRINQLALSNQRKTLWGLAAGLLLISIIGVLLYRQSKTRQQTNQTLLALNKELDTANKVKARFFAIMSHDLRAPIVNVINFLHLRRSDPELLTPQETAQHEQQLTNSAEALLENMETLLLWSKSQLEQLKPHITEVDSNELLQYIEQQFRHITQVQWQFDNSSNYTFHTDENCARTILYNLTSNAVKAVATLEQPAIAWTAYIKNKQLVMAISDNGQGIDPALLDNDAHRNDSASSVKTGMGLSIVKDLAKAIGCTVQVAPAAQGTTIQVIFPIHPPNAV